MAPPFGRALPLLATAVLTLMALSGCAAEGAFPDGSSPAGVPPSATASSAAATQSGLPTPPVPTPTATPPSPMVFTGHILAPDPFVYDFGICGGSSSPPLSPMAEGITWQSFRWDTPLYGWTYSFDVDGMVAFNQIRTNSASSGAVPPDALEVRVCSPDHADLYYNLTLTPPGPVVFSGHAYLPRVGHHVGHCHGFYIAATDYAIAPWTTTTFALSQDYSAWAFSVNVPGLFVEFHPNEDERPVATSGTVPDGAYEVLVCNESGIDTDFQLMLTPPV